VNVLEGWPDTVRFSMAPFMYSTTARRIDVDETSSFYRCQEAGCQFRANLDRRFTDAALVLQLLGEHMDANH
jgi:hypothetical protein